MYYRIFLILWTQTPFFLGKQWLHGQSWYRNFSWKWLLKNSCCCIWFRLGSSGRSGSYLATGLTIFSLITCFLLKLQLKQCLLTNILTPIETTDTANILRFNKENNFNFYHVNRSSKPIKLFQTQKGVTAMIESFKTFLRDFKDVLFCNGLPRNRL